MRIAVVGAGLSGLTCALRLHNAGHQVEVIEASDHPGGRMWTRDVEGVRVDIGTHMLLDNYVRTRQLADEVGLGDTWFEVSGGEGGGVLHDHETRSFSPKNAFDVLRFRGLNLRGRIRLALAFLASRRYASELDFFDLSVGDDTLDTEDCETFARRKLGDEATDYIVDCFIRTFHFHGARKMSLKYFEALCSLLIEGGEFQVCALRGRMGSLPAAIAKRLSVRYGQRVREVHPIAQGVFVDAGRGAERFDAVVIATPAELARAMLSAPSAAQQGLLANAESSKTVFSAFSLPTESAGTFEGIWVPFVESHIISGLGSDYCLGQPQGDQTVFSVWLHEEAAEAWWERSDAEIQCDTRAELERLFPRFEGLLTPVHLERWPHALPVYAVGQVSRVRAFWEHGQGDGGVWLCGDYLNHPWVEGAVRCGEKVAARLHAGALGG